MWSSGLGAILRDCTYNYKNSQVICLRPVGIPKVVVLLCFIGPEKLLHLGSGQLNMNVCIYV